MDTKKAITVQAVVNAPVEKVWEYWTAPGHIMQWNNASDDWHTPRAENDLRTGGKFLFRMEAKDKSMGFDFEGNYTKVKPHEALEYTIADGRTVVIRFEEVDSKTRMDITFEAENENPKELQREGWQAILNNFKKHVEESK